MATFNLIGYARDRLGNSINSATAQGFLVNTDGSHGAACTGLIPVSAGKWVVPINTSTMTSPSGLYAVEVVNGTDVRWVEPYSTIMVSALLGVNGAAPLGSDSITDTMIGTRTINDLAVASSNVGDLPTLLSGIGHSLKTIMHGGAGGVHWYDTPLTSLDDARAHIVTNLTDNPHSVTAAQTGAVHKSANGPTNIFGGSGAPGALSAQALGDLYVKQDSPRAIYYATGSSAWALAASMNYSDLLGIPSGSFTPHQHSGDDIVTSGAVNGGTGHPVNVALLANTATTATQLIGQSGKNFPVLNGSTAAVTGSFVQGSSQLAIQVGHVDTLATDASGNGTITLPSPVQGTLHVTLTAAGGSHPGVSVQPRSYPTAGNQTLDVKVSGGNYTPSQAIFVTYLFIGW